MPPSHVPKSQDPALQRFKIASAMRRLLDRVEECVTTFAILAIVVLIFTAVVLRYGFDSGLLWGEEIANVLFIGMSYLAISRAEALGLHFRVTILHDNFPRARPYLELLTQLIQAALLLYLCYLAWTLTAFVMEVEQKLPASSLPSYLFYVPIVVGLFLGAIRSLEKFTKSIVILGRRG